MLAEEKAKASGRHTFAHRSRNVGVVVPLGTTRIHRVCAAIEYIHVLHVGTSKLFFKKNAGRAGVIVYQV